MTTIITTHGNTPGATITRAEPKAVVVQPAARQHRLASLTARELNAMNARMDKHDRELAALQYLVVRVARGEDWLTEVLELRESGRTYANIAGHMDLTRALVVAALNSAEQEV